MERTDWLRLVAIVAAAIHGDGARAQQLPPAVLDVRIENVRLYWRDTPDVSRFATDAENTTGVRGRNFEMAEGAGDIMEVNGQAARGTLMIGISGMTLSPTPTTRPGTGIADVQS